MGCDKVSLYSPFIQRFTDVLAQDGRFGMCQSVARIKDTKSGATSVTQGPCGDRFKIALNYAAYTIEWEVLFNHHCPEEPPDFILSQEEFQPQLEHIKSLVNWDAADPRALLNTVNEMLEEYKRYQASILTEASMLNYHYTSLLDQNEEFHLSDSDIEIHAAKKGPRIGPINFLMKLPVDFTRIPPYLTKDCPGEDSAVLLVTFQNAEGGKVTPQLYLSPRVEHVLGGVGALRIPGYPAGGLLLDYVPTVCQLLQAKRCYRVRRGEFPDDLPAPGMARLLLCRLSGADRGVSHLSAGPHDAVRVSPVRGGGPLPQSTHNVPVQSSLESHRDGRKSTNISAG